MFFDPDHFFVDFFRQCTLCCFPVHIAQEGCYIRVKGITFAFRVQEDLCRKIPQLQTFLFDAAMAEGIHGEIFTEGVEGTDEDDEGLFQLCIVLPFFQLVHIDHALIVAGPLREFPFTAIRTLHLDVIDMAVFIVHIDVKTDTFAVVAVVYGFFAFWKCDLFDPDAQNLLDQVFADPLVLHDFLEKKIILDGQLFPLFESSHGITAFLPVL